MDDLKQHTKSEEPSGMTDAELLELCGPCQFGENHIWFKSQPDREAVACHCGAVLTIGKIRELMVALPRLIADAWGADRYTIYALDGLAEDVRSLRKRLEAARNAMTIAIVALACYNTSDNELDNVREMLEAALAKEET